MSPTSAAAEATDVIETDKDVKHAVEYTGDLSKRIAKHLPFNVAVGVGLTTNKAAGHTTTAHQGIRSAELAITDKAAAATTIAGIV